jgi:uncharacterized protein involved in type VI secretion and phage assembly
MSQMNGVVMGIVRSLDDPQNLGRVQIYFPWLSETNQSYWARIATLMAGSERGSWFMPEVGDEVLVAFEHGNSQHPYIVGFLWNGQSKPPNKGINRQVRRLQTVSGHILEFDDRPGLEKITIKTRIGNEISITETPSGINISTPTGRLTINCLQADITASTMLTVNAPLAQFSGVVQASAFTGGAYTPAPGNTFGL